MTHQELSEETLEKLKILYARNNSLAHETQDWFEQGNLIKKLIGITPRLSDCLLLVEMPIGEIMLMSATGIKTIDGLMDRITGEDAVNTKFYLLSTIEEQLQFSVYDEVHISMEGGALDPMPSVSNKILNKFKQDISEIHSAVRKEGANVNYLSKSTIRFVIQIPKYSVINTVGRTNLKLFEETLIMALVNCTLDELLNIPMNSEGVTIDYITNIKFKIFLSSLAKLGLIEAGNDAARVINMHVNSSSKIKQL